MPLRSLLALTLWASAVGPAGAAAPAPNLISNVEVMDEGRSLRVVIKGSRPASFTTFSMADPPRFVVDVAGAEFKGVPRDIAVKDGTIQVIKNLALQGESGAVARIMLAFQGEVDPPGVAAAGNSLVVTVARRQGEVAARAPAAAEHGSEPVAAATTETQTFTPPAAAPRTATPSAPPAVAAAPAGHVPEPPAVAAEPAPRLAEPPAAAGAPVASSTPTAAAVPEPPAEPEPEPAPAPAPAPHPRKRHAVSRERPLRVQELGFRQTDAASRVFVRVSAAPRYRVVEAGEKMIRVELPDTRVSRPNDARYLDTSFFPSAVAMVVPKREGSGTVLEITLREKVQYQQRVEGDTLSIDFERPGAAPRAPAAIEPEKAPTAGE